MPRIFYRGANNRIKARADALGKALMRPHHQAALALLFEQKLDAYRVVGTAFSNITVVVLQSMDKRESGRTDDDQKLFDYVAKCPDLIPLLETYTEEEIENYNESVLASAGLK